MSKALTQLISTYDETSPFAEAYRVLRNGLLQRNGNPLWSLGITGANPQHGSTTTAANLSLIMAESEKRVVLVDADLYKPSLHRYFEISNDCGLTSVLQGEVNVDRALQVVSGQPSLAILPAGPEVRNPAALLQPVAVQALLDSLRGKSDFLIVDLPSVGAVAYTSFLARFMDGLLLVVRAGTSPASADRLIKQQLPGVNVVGLLLNQAPVNRDKAAAQYYATASRSSSVRTK